MIETYQERAYATAVFPEQFAIPYIALKLCGETGELMEKQLQKGTTWESIALEAGDCCWYIAALCENLGVKFHELQRVRHTGAPSDIWPVLLASQIAETIGKSLREGQTTLSKERGVKVIDLLARMRSRIEDEMTRIGYTLEQVLEMNLAKLASRQQRGTLVGEGDAR